MIYLDFLVIFFTILFFKILSKFLGTLNLKLRLLTVILIILRFLIVFFSERVTTSTSGNSGI